MQGRRPRGQCGAIPALAVSGSDRRAYPQLAARAAPPRPLRPLGVRCAPPRMERPRYAAVRGPELSITAVLRRWIQLPLPRAAAEPSHPRSAKVVATYEFAAAPSLSRLIFLAGLEYFKHLWHNYGATVLQLERGFATYSLILQIFSLHFILLQLEPLVRQEVEEPEVEMTLPEKLLVQLQPQLVSFAAFFSTRRRVLRLI